MSDGTAATFDVVDQLAIAKVVPVIRTHSRENAVRAITILAEEEFRVFEVTLTTPGACSVIEVMSLKENLLLGAGTVLSGDDVQRVADSGARFAVAPNYWHGFSASCFAHQLSMIPGAATPTEIFNAHQSGAAVVKLFPAAQLGGPDFIRAVRSVFPDTRFMPTGGIDLDNLNTYLATDSVCVGMGGSLVNDSLLSQRSDREIRLICRAVHTIIEASV